MPSEVVVNFKADVDKAIANVKNVGDQINKLEKRNEALGKQSQLTGSRMLKAFRGGLVNSIKQVGTAIKGLTVVGIGGLSIAFAKAFKDATDFGENLSKMQTVFKGLEDRTDAIRKNLVKSFNLSDTKAVEFLGTIGQVTQSMGYARDASLELSNRLIQLASDQASFTNSKVEDVLHAYVSSINGERESLKTYGIAINEADVQQQLLMDGTANLTGEALKQAKANATVTLITQKMGVANGDVGRTMDSTANKIRSIGNWFQDLSVKVGILLSKHFDPLVTKVRDFTADTANTNKILSIVSKIISEVVFTIEALVKVFQKIGSVIDKVRDKFSEFGKYADEIKAVLALIGGTLMIAMVANMKLIAGVITATLIPKIVALGASLLAMSLSNPFTAILLGLTSLVAGIAIGARLIVKHWDKVKIKIGILVGQIVIKLSEIKNFIGDKLLGAIGKLLSKLSEIPLIGGYFNTAKGFVNDFANANKKANDKIIADNKRRVEELNKLNKELDKGKKDLEDAESSQGSGSGGSGSGSGDDGAGGKEKELTKNLTNNMAKATNAIDQALFKWGRSLQVAEDQLSTFADNTFNAIATIATKTTDILASGFDIANSMDQGRINQTNEKIESIDEELEALEEKESAGKALTASEVGRMHQLKNEKMKSEKDLESLRKKQAVRDKASAISSTIISTSLGVMEIVRSRGTKNFILDAILKAVLISATLAQGASQLAKIRSTPAYEKGGIIPAGQSALVGDSSTGSPNPEVIVPRSESLALPVSLLDGLGSQLGDQESTVNNTTNNNKNVYNTIQVDVHGIEDLEKLNNEFRRGEGVNL